MTTIPDYLAELGVRFASGGDWGDSLRNLLAMEAELPSMSETLKTEETRFHGCQSQIWLVITLNGSTGKVEISANSDSRIMRGLLAVAHGFYNNRTPDEIAANPPALLRDTGLLDAMAPSRANGFYRLLMHVHQYGASLCHSTKGDVA